MRKVSELKYLLVKITLGVIIIAVTSCSYRKNSQIDVLTSFDGKEIIFPDNLEIVINGTPLNCEFYGDTYTIVTYVDSSNCTSCKMRLLRWSDIIHELNSICEENVGFVMIVNSNDNAEVNEIINRDKFLYPIALNGSESFYEINSLPDDDKYHTFLLNSDNEVVVIGNPTINPKIKELYKKVVIGNLGSVNENKKFCLYSDMSLGILSPLDSVSRSFSLYNDTEDVITIQDIITSCGCISALASAEAMSPNEKIVITVTLQTDSIYGPFKQFVDIFYNEFDSAERLTMCGYVNNCIIN